MSATALPTPAAARSIVSNLWAQREGALSLLNSDMLGPYETGAARQLDDAYVSGVLCQCTPQKDEHPVLQVIPEVPKSSVEPVFFAEVHTTNGTTHEHPWYVVAVTRDAGSWKLAFVTFGTNAAAPPLSELGTASTYTPAVTAAVRTRMARMAGYSARWTTTHTPQVAQNSYGGTVHTHAAIEASKDKVYGLSLPSGKVLSCFTLHVIGTTTLAGGLEQGAAQSQWGKTLAPGVYRSVTVDTATPQCMVGSGVGTVPGKLRMQYDDTVVGVTGVTR